MFVQQSGVHLPQSELHYLMKDGGMDLPSYNQEDKMGTNYYAHDVSNTCPTCNHNPAKPLHIGKSSSGWVFALHTIPEDNLTSLDDWVSYLRSDSITIKDEYGDHVALDALLEVIMNRGRPESQHMTPEWLRQNHAEIGPNNLARHPIGDYCAGHGAGTWSMTPGYFC